MEGTVTGEDGAPVPGAQVVLEHMEAGVDRYARGVDSPEKVGYSLTDGRFRLEGAQPGPSAITVSAMGFAPKRIEGIEAGELPGHIAIVLQRGHSIAGRVVDHTGAPIVLADVVALPEETGGGGESEFVRRMDLRMVQGIASTLTGMDGRYRLGPLPPGFFKLLGRCEGYEAASVGPVTGRSASDLVLVRFAALRGAVLDHETREPVPRFRIEAIKKKEIPPAPADSGSQGDIEFYDIDGRFLYDGLRPGAYAVSVRSRGFAPQLREVVLAAGEVMDMDVALERGFRVEGVLIDSENGGPIAGAMVSAQARGAAFVPGAHSLLDTVTSVDGSFSIKGLLAGEHTLFAIHPHCAFSARGDLDFRLPGAETFRLEIRLRPAGRLQGWIDGLEPFMGKPAAERPSLVLAGAGAEGGVAVEVFPTGFFAVDHVEPGSYRLELHVGESDVPGKVLGDVLIRLGETAYVTFDVR